MEFHLLAGTGVGAMNAAFVACDQFEALQAFWDRIGLRRLLSFNWRTPWRAPLAGTPQRRFVSAHVSEEALRRSGRVLLISTFDMRTGRQHVLRYPGQRLPLVDAVMAAVATPGLIPPVLDGQAQRAEGTVISSFLLREVVREHIDEVVAIAAGLPASGGQIRHYTTWRAVLERALAMNLAHDVDDAAEHVGLMSAALQAVQRIAATLPKAVGAEIRDTELRTRLTERFARIFERSPSAELARVAPVRVIRPSSELGYPLWRFRRSDLAAAQRLGDADARAALFPRA